MKKLFYSIILSLFFAVALSLNVSAMTDEQMDIYNHQYYPQSVNNGGINQALQENTNEFYVSPVTGNATVRVTDIILPGKNGFDLEISRVYSSFSSNFYEPYVKEVEKYTSTPFYMVSGQKDFEKTQSSTNTIVESGYNDPICINEKYYDYTTDDDKFENMSIFEFSRCDYNVSDLFESEDEAYALANTLNNTIRDISANHPVSNVGYYWADYKNFTVETLYIDVYTPDYETWLLPDTSNV